MITPPPVPQAMQPLRLDGKVYDPVQMIADRDAATMRLQRLIGNIASDPPEVQSLMADDIDELQALNEQHKAALDGFLTMRGMITWK